MIRALLIFGVAVVAFIIAWSFLPAIPISVGFAAWMVLAIVLLVWATRPRFHRRKPPMR